MLELERVKTFKKDISRQKFSNKHYAKYILYLGYLLDGKELPKEAKDHELKGRWSGYREFHISGDLLLIPCSQTVFGSVYILYNSYNIKIPKYNLGTSRTSIFSYV